jgi:L-iditol 2-dehydrogenase
VFPAVPGHEITGRIADLGPDHAGEDFLGRSLEVGDRIVVCPDVLCGDCYYCNHTYPYTWCENMETLGHSYRSDEPPHLFGGWAEQMVVPERAFVYRVPEGIPPELSVLTEPLAAASGVDIAREASSMLVGEGLTTGGTVVIQGAGSLGICALLRARFLGAGEIVVVDPSRQSRGLARSLGADRAIDPDETTKRERLELVRSATDGRGADLVVECAGVPEIIPEGIEMLRRGGTYVEAGVFVDKGEISINPHEHLNANGVRIVGTPNHPVTQYEPGLELLDRMAEGLALDEIVTHRFSLSEPETAMETSLAEESLKVVFEP